MILIPIRCPHCQETNICRNGRTRTGKQRYCCKNLECPYRTFTLEAHPYHGSRKEVKEKIVTMAVNGSGVRDTARTLKISPVTVLNELKKRQKKIENVNRKLLAHLNPEDVEVVIYRDGNSEVSKSVTEKAEVDEMQSFVGNKSNKRWLWHAIDHNSGQVLAYILGNRQEQVFLQLQKLLKPFGVQKFYTDKLPTYSRHLTEEQHEISKYKMQKIERKHLTLRTRIK